MFKIKPKNGDYRFGGDRQGLPVKRRSEEHGMARIDVDCGEILTLCNMNVTFLEGDHENEAITYVHFIDLVTDGLLVEVSTSEDDTTAL